MLNWSQKPMHGVSTR